MPIIRTKPRHTGTLAMLAATDSSSPSWDFLSILRFLKDLVVSPFTAKDATGASIDNLEELKALIRARDLEIVQLQDGLVKKSAAWAKKNMPAWYDWQADFSNLQTRYAIAKDQADKIVQGRLSRHVQFGPDVPGPEMAGWANHGAELILAALRKIPGQVSKGDLQDLRIRLAEALAGPSFVPTPQWVPTPQPTQVRSQSTVLPPVPADLAIPADEKPGFFDKWTNSPFVLAGAAAVLTAAVASTALTLIKNRDENSKGTTK